MNRNLTGWIISGIGIIVTSFGRLIGGRVGAGITGFGLAHIMLGFLDRIRS